MKFKFKNKQVKKNILINLKKDILLCGSHGGIRKKKIIIDYYLLLDKMIFKQLKKC